MSLFFFIYLFAAVTCLTVGYILGCRDTALKQKQDGQKQGGAL
jgi:hypothetical protein